MKRKKGKQSNQKKTKAVSCATAKKNIFGDFNLTFLTMFDTLTHTYTHTHTQTHTHTHTHQNYNLKYNIYIRFYLKVYHRFIVLQDSSV